MYNRYEKERGVIMKLKKLIVNADDFGMTEANTIATILCHEDGILSSTTMMMNMPYVELAAKLAKEHPSLGVGIHFVLTVGRPLVEGAKSYTDENGNFRRPKSYEDGKPHADLDELYTEWKAQMEKFIQVMGKKPTHIDSHHHAHNLPWHLPVTMRLAKEYDLPVRIRVGLYPDDYEYEQAPMVTGFYEDTATEKYFTTNEFGLWDHEVAEVMCHPSFVDQRLYNMSSYALPRMNEMAVLRSDEVKQWVKDNNIELITFDTLKKVS